MLRELQIKNFRSFPEVVVELGSLNVFVGLNGAGKGNLLDALAFVNDCLSDSIETALRRRGGIDAVRRKSVGHPTNIGIRLVMELDGAHADYSFEIRAKQGKRFEIARERCVVKPLLDDETRFVREGDSFRMPIPGVSARMAPDRLALFAASAVEPYRQVFEFLTDMRIYSIAPSKLRDYQDGGDPGDVLHTEGDNAAAVLKQIQDAPDASGYTRVKSLLSSAVQGISSVEHLAIRQKETILFKQDVGAKSPWEFEALNMSDGTLRLLGLLLAVYQPSRPPLIGIEEPESTVHPAVTELIVDVLADTSRERQVLITTHSPDLLDSDKLLDDQIKVVVSRANRTTVAPLSQFGRGAIRDGLYSPGELLRVNELNPDLDRAAELAAQLDLFGSPFRIGA